MIKKTIAVAALSTFMLSGCATIISDSQYPVTIQSNPAGARFTIKDDDGVIVHSGRTPSSVSLKSGNGYFSKANYVIEYKKNGFEPAIYQLNARLDGWYIGNILFGLIGAPIGFLIVDPMTGAMYKLPKIADATLNFKAASNDSSSLNIVSYNELSEDDKKNLVRIN